MRIILLIASTVIMMGCNLGDIFSSNYEWEAPVELNTSTAIIQFMKHYKYDYKRDSIGDRWNLPDQTFNRETVGNDCEDTAVLFAYFYDRIGYRVRMVGLAPTENNIGAGNHMIYRVNGYLYESTGRSRGSEFYLFDDWEIIYEKSYDDYIDEVQRKSYNRNSSPSGIEFGGE